MKPLDRSSVQIFSMYDEKDSHHFWERSIASESTISSNSSFDIHLWTGEKTRGIVECKIIVLTNETNYEMSRIHCIFRYVDRCIVDWSIDTKNANDKDKKFLRKHSRRLLLRMTCCLKQARRWMRTNLSIDWCSTGTDNNNQHDRDT